MNAPRFTVLMPTHYRADIIGLAIESVLAQTETSFELLVVGDGAEAGTEEAVRAFDDPRVRWFDFPKAPNFGYANRNRALKEARGELVAFAADDDLMLPDHLERMGAAFADPSVQWAHSQALWVSADGIAGPDLTNLDLPDEREYFRVHGNTLAAGTVVYRASAFSGREAWPESIREAGDWVMWKTLLDLYGVRGLQTVRQTTLLHFTAGRKDRRDSGFDLLAGYLGVAEKVGWWPEALRPPVVDGETVQAAYLRAMRQPGWVDAVRSAAAQVVDRMALDYLAPRATVVYPIGRERWAARAVLAEVDALKSINASLVQQLEAMRSSTIWRATAPLRAVMHRLRGVRLP